MIIGISGKIGSGKDTVGSMWQYLELLERMEKDSTSTSDYFLSEQMNIGGIELVKKNRWLEDSSWEIKKFAGKLKDIVCLLIGCTREQLEDREFKNKELGEDWWYFSLNKFHLMIPYANFDEEFDIIKSFYGDTYRVSEFKLIKLTPRKILQLLGTEAGRQVIHPNIWINALFADYKKEECCGKQYSCDYGDGYNCTKNLKEPNWIITDVRFPNEVKAIKDKGGIVIRVERPLESGVDDTLFELDEKGRLTPHPSETALDNYENWDYVIKNKGTLEELLEEVKTIYTEIKGRQKS